MGSLLASPVCMLHILILLTRFKKHLQIADDIIPARRFCGLLIGAEKKQAVGRRSLPVNTIAKLNRSSVSQNFSSGTEDAKVCNSTAGPPKSLDVLV